MSEFIFDKTKGKYFLDGTELVRVTTVLNIVSKPALYFWYGKHGTEKCKEILTTAATIGTGVHNILERLGNHLLGKDEPVKYFASPLQETSHAYLADWFKENNAKILSTEHRIYHTKYHFAGTCDGVVEIDGKLVMIDYKTSAYCYDTYALQLAAYKNAYEDMNPGQKIDRCLILRFEKDAEKNNKFEVFEVNDLDKQWTAFKHALQLFRWEKSRGKFSKLKSPSEAAKEK